MGMLQTITYTIWGFRNPTPVNIFEQEKGNLRYNARLRKQSL